MPASARSPASRSRTPTSGSTAWSCSSRDSPPNAPLERLIEGDPGRDLRQLGIVDKDGRAAAYTGDRCIPWAGQVFGAGYVCLGNILAGEEVVQAMAQAFETTLIEELPERLIQALEAGQEAGGDRRGRQSAGITVVAEEAYPLCDLRVDDHADPVPELRRVLRGLQGRRGPVPPDDAAPRRSDPRLAGRGQAPRDDRRVRCEKSS